MKILISEVFMAILMVALAVAGFLFVKNSVLQGVQEFGERLEERKSIRQVESGVKRLTSERLRSLAVEVMLWDTRRRMEWLQTKSMLKGAQKEREIELCRQRLSEESAHASALVNDMRDKEIVNMIRKEIRSRAVSWRLDLLKRLKA